MKNAIFILISVCSFFVAKSQECPHYFKVMNVYRKDDRTITEYAKEFVSDNRELFLSDQKSYLKASALEIPNFVSYSTNDSGIVANCVYIYHEDSIFAKIGFFAKNNRTKVILVSTQNYNGDNMEREFIKNKVDIIIERYHKLLKSKSGDSKHW